MRPDKGLLGSLVQCKQEFLERLGNVTYRLRRCVRNMRVVFSKDLTSTFVFGVIGELASFSGLKLRTVLRMRLDVFGLVRVKIERQLRVASTSRASLRERSAVRFRGADFQYSPPAVVL